MRLLAVLLLCACTSAAKRDKATARVDLGTAYLRESNPQSAIVVLEQATRLDGRNWDAWNKLGLAYMAAGASDRAEKAFKKAMRIAGDKAEVNNGYGLMLLGDGRLDEAIEHFEAATGDITYRNQALVLNNLGYALFLSERYDEAIQRLDDAIKRSPNLCEARFHRGRAWQESGDPERALADLDAVISMCSEQAPGAYYHGAQALLTLDQATGACTYLRSVLRESPMTDLSDQAAELYNQECDSSPSGDRGGDE